MPGAASGGDSGAGVWVNLDHGQHGIGSQSCGPGPLPQYFLNAAPAEFTFVFTASGQENV